MSATAGSVAHLIARLIAHHLRAVFCFAMRCSGIACPDALWGWLLTKLSFLPVLPAPSLIHHWQTYSTVLMSGQLDGSCTSLTAGGIVSGPSIIERQC